VPDQPFAGQPTREGDLRVVPAAAEPFGWRRHPNLRRAYVGGALFFIVYPLIGLLQSGLATPLVVLGLAGWAIFVTALLLAVRQGDFSRGLTGAWLVAVILALIAIGGALELLDPQADWAVLFFYGGVIAGRLVPDRRALGGVATVSIVASLTRAYATGDVGAGASLGFEVLLISLGLFSLAALARSYEALDAAQHELARLAVADERNRIARDLHDTLGQSLSVIALKAQLARRLLPADGAFDRPRTELADVENVARDALASVRETVSGYRQPNLREELAGARSALTAAGIEGRMDAVADPLPPLVEAVLAWTVREGVTNVVRHSGARHANVEISRDGGWVQGVVEDDGRGIGPRDGAGARTGVGLAGLYERVGAVGGSYEVGSGPMGGFRLAVRLPLEVRP
jgi:two-component system, NarL family, sensor histidine kinase DesK